jgi:hypothetical protein
MRLSPATGGSFGGGELHSGPDDAVFDAIRPMVFFTGKYGKGPAIRRW